jgi:hypothetical protein
MIWRLRASRRENSSGRAETLVEGPHLQPGAAAEHTRKGLGGRAQEVHVRVEHGLVPTRRATVADQPLRRRPAARRLHGPGPDQTRRAQLGDFHEEVRAEPEGEQHPRRRLVEADPAIVQGPQVGDPGRQRKGELLHGVRAGVGPDRSVDADRADLETVTARMRGRRRQTVEGGGGGHRQRTGPQPLGERVARDRAVQPAGGGAGLSLPGLERRQHGGRRHAGGREDRHGPEVDALQQRAGVVDGAERHPAVAQLGRRGPVRREPVARGGVERQHDGVLAAVQVGPQGGVELRRSEHPRMLAKEPAGGTAAQRVRAAHVRRQAGPGEVGAEFLAVGARINRLQIDPLGGAGDEFLLERGSVERFLGGLAPVGVSGRGELRQERCGGG